MAEKPASEKTEQPTPKKIRKAREKGQVVQSQELPAAISIVVLLMALTLASPSLLQCFTAQIRLGLSCQTDVFVDSKTFLNHFSSQIADGVWAMTPVLAALTIGSVLACVVVGGLNVAPKAIKLKLSEVDPVKGFGKLFSIKSVVKLGISILKLIFVSAIVYFYLRDRLDELAVIQWAWSAQIMISISKMISSMLIRVCIGLLVIAVIDVVFQKWKYTQDLKMTKQEVKQEGKETDGSPEVKSRIRQIQIAMARKRMLQEVPKANVIIVNPTHYAVALKYDVKTMDAPIVVAKGADHVAEKIREIARAHGVPIIRKPALARSIYANVESGNPIPAKLFAAVAEVLAMIYRLRHVRN
jgi:flagellar biosynthetic protein FlhB